MPGRLKVLNRIRIKDSDLDFFKDFFNKHYNGEPMPKCFKEVIIEITDSKNKIELYVDYRQEDKVYIHCYINDMRHIIVFMDESSKAMEASEKGEYLTVTSTKVDEEFALLTGGNIPKQFIEEMSMYMADVFNYMFLYYDIMKDTMIEYAEDVNYNQTQNKKHGKKKQKKKINRRIVYVPRCVKIKSENDGASTKAKMMETKDKEEITRTVDGEKIAKQPKYIKPEWKRKGSTYYNKRGTLVVRGPSTCHRKKALAEEGVDFIFRPLSESEEAK